MWSWTEERNGGSGCKVMESKILQPLLQSERGDWKDHKDMNRSGVGIRVKGENRVSSDLEILSNGTRCLLTLDWSLSSRLDLYQEGILVFVSHEFRKPMHME